MCAVFATLRAAMSHAGNRFDSIPEVSSTQAAMAARSSPMRAVRVVFVVGLCFAVSGCALRTVRTCLDHAVLCAAGVAVTAGAAYYLLQDDGMPAP